MKKLFCLILLFSFFFAFTQKDAKKISNSEKHGYKITIGVVNAKPTSIYLKFFKGSSKSTSILDSAKINKSKQEIVFKKTDDIVNFPILLSAKDENNSIMLFLKNGINVNLNLNGDNLQDIVVNDALNRDFITYQKEKNPINKIILAQKMLSVYQDDGIAAFFNFELIRLQATDKSKLDLAVTNAEKTVNFSDKVIPLLPNSYGFLNAYFNNSINYVTAVDSVLKNLNCENPSFKFYIEWIMKNLEYRTSLAENTQDAYKYLMKNYASKGDCQPDLIRDFAKINFLIKEYETLPLGQPLPDFSLRDTSGKIYDFNQYLLDHKNITLMIFFDPNCEHCIESVPKEVQQVDDLEKKLNIKFNKVAVLYIGVESEWQKFITKSHLQNWFNVISSGKGKRISELIPITGTPAFFILDKNGNLLVKSFNEEILRDAVINQKKH